MIIKRITYLLLFVAASGITQAQQIADYRFNLAFAKPGKGVIHAELGFNRDLFNFLDNDLRFGFGARMGFQNNKEIAFTTARKELKKKKELVDELYFDKVQSMSFNLYLQAEYYIKPRFSAGMNLDLVGISAGFEKEGVYRPGPTSIAAGFMVDTQVKAIPTESNAILIGSQKGSILSQIYVRFEPKKQIGLKAGYSIVMTEFSTVETHGSNNQFRFENNTSGFFLGVSFNKFDNK